MSCNIKLKSIVTTHICVVQFQLSIKDCLIKIISKYTLPDVSFPDFDAVTYTFVGLNNVFLTIGPNSPSASFKTIKKGDNNLPSAVIVGCIV